MSVRPGDTRTTQRGQGTNQMGTLKKAITISPRVAAMVLIKGYRMILSPMLPPSCRYQPTCSAYALEAFDRFGVIKGGWLAARRVARCHPWGGHGYDPVPANDTRHSSFEHPSKPLTR